MLDEVGVLYRGLVLGVMVAAPVGPIGLMCIRRTLHKGFIIGFATGVGAAFADCFFGGVAALGVSAIIDFIRDYDACIRVLGGFLLLFGAWHTWHDPPRQPTDPVGLVKKVIGMTREDMLMGALKAVISSLAITLANPLTLFGVLAVVATFGHVQNTDDAVTLTGGIFFGSLCWWLLLAGGMALLRGHFTENRVVWLNRITGIALAVLAVWAVISGIQIGLHFSL
ncbi:MAG: LysE family transporter [Alphaproteobacteria bacterium]|nr:LysE family transporter [Alphaproteobacteria bacterium]MBV8548247.1 LysE family transporter [Alphaproteobacteria bacterium]